MYVVGLDKSVCVWTNSSTIGSFTALVIVNDVLLISQRNLTSKNFVRRVHTISDNFAKLICGVHL